MLTIILCILIIYFVLCLPFSQLVQISLSSIAKRDLCNYRHRLRDHILRFLSCYLPIQGVDLLEFKRVLLRHDLFPMVSAFLLVFATLLLICYICFILGLILLLLIIILRLVWVPNRIIRSIRMLWGEVAHMTWWNAWACFVGDAAFALVLLLHLAIVI